MEAKEVLTSLLTEHKEFNDTVTSYQIDGISNKDMLSKTDKEPESIKELLLQCEGILAVERTFHTETKGQWLLVIQKNKTQTVTNYINSNIEKIYRKKREKKTRLITYKSDATSKAYRLQIVPTYTGKVGTYAEVLKKRFVKNTQTQKPSDANRNEKPPEKNYTENNSYNTDQDNIDLDLREDSILHFPPLEDTGTKEINMYEHKNKHSNNISQDTVTVSNTEMNENKETNLNKETLEISKTVQQITNENNRRLEEFQIQLEKKVEQMMEKRIMEVSMVVANTVAGKLTEAFKNMFQQTITEWKRHSPQSKKSISFIPPQVSPLTQTKKQSKILTTHESDSQMNVESCTRDLLNDISGKKQIAES